MSSPLWQPANQTERALARAVAGGDTAEFLRRVVAAELYLPQVPREGEILRESAEGWLPLTRQIAGNPAVPLFTSLAGMGSVMVVMRYAVTSFTEVRDRWAGPDWWVAINPGLPIDAYLPFDEVGRIIDGELPVEEAGAERAGEGGAAAAGERSLEALLDATVTVPTTRPADYPDALLEPGFPWQLSSTAATPTIEVFTSAERFARAYPGRPSVRIPFLLLMIAWPSGHALSVDPGSPVELTCTAREVALLQRRAVAG